MCHNVTLTNKKLGVSRQFVQQKCLNILHAVLQYEDIVHLLNTILSLTRVYLYSSPSHVQILLGNE
jgi:hypothetical protein